MGEAVSGGRGRKNDIRKCEINCGFPRLVCRDIMYGAYDALYMNAECLLILRFFQTTKMNNALLQSPIMDQLRYEGKSRTV